MKKLISVLLAMVLCVGLLSSVGTAQAATLTSTAGTVNVSSGRLNVRSGQSTGSAVVASLNKGSYVTLISKSGSWWYVEYAKGKYGYSHADYIKQVSSSAATVQVSSGNLNVRSGAGTGYSIVDKLPKGETVVILSNSGGWSRILYHGVKTGYVSNQYLSKGQTQGQYAPISLNVPNFKQTDSRWANVIIGNSGKTIAQIGCVTTAIAMMESYRSGKTIYPDAMSKKLSYSSSGNLYWPSDYQVVFENSNILNALYQKLKEGKPVLYGAKTSAGKQHWVVVVGYTGGNTLSASQFVIRDPGSNSRVNLQQFMNAYPVFYKYFYYK